MNINTIYNKTSHKIPTYKVIESHSIFFDENYKAITTSKNPRIDFPKINGLREKHIPLKIV